MAEDQAAAEPFQVVDLFQVLAQVPVPAGIGQQVFNGIQPGLDLPAVLEREEEAAAQQTRPHGRTGQVEDREQRALAPAADNGPGQFQVAAG